MKPTRFSAAVLVGLSFLGLHSPQAIFALEMPALEMPALEMPAVSEAGAESETPEPSPRIEILNARQPQPGLLVGGQPTEEQFAEAAKAGYKVVMTLRGEGELSNRDEKAEVEKAGMKFVALPIAGREAVNETNARALAELLEAYGDEPVLLHCGSGNRVGGLLALKAHFVDGVSPEEALSFGLDAGLTSLESVVRERLGL